MRALGGVGGLPATLAGPPESLEGALTSPWTSRRQESVYFAQPAAGWRARSERRRIDRARRARPRFWPSEAACAKKGEETDQLESVGHRRNL